MTEEVHVTRRALAMWSTRVIGLRRLYAAVGVTFEARSISWQQAMAHLLLHYPQGSIVIAGKRGPLGGWGTLHCANDVGHLPASPSTSRTFHICVGVWK